LFIDNEFFVLSFRPSFQIEFSEQPIKQNTLVVNCRSARLGKEMNLIWFWQCSILQTLIAVRANGTEIFYFSIKLNVSLITKEIKKSFKAIK